MNISHKKRFKQSILFKGLNHGKLYPTDLDGLLEYKNKGYIFFEVKGKEAEVKTGQKIALERLVKDTGENKLSVAVIMDHEVTDPEDDIILKDCTVREIYTSEYTQWRKPKPKFRGNYTADLFFNEVIEELDTRG